MAEEEYANGLMNRTHSWKGMWKIENRKGGEVRPSAEGRKREWFKIEEAVKVLQYHKPVQASYFEALRQGYSANNGTPVLPTTYSSSMSGIR